MAAQQPPRRPTASVAPPRSAPSAPPSDEPSVEPSAAGITCDTADQVGLVTDVGRVNDKGFNQSAYEGMEAARPKRPTCFETEYIETTSQSDYAANIAQFTDSGSNVVIGVGFLLGDALGDAAKANPDIKFISVDGVPNPGHDESWMTNGESLFFAEDEAGYLAGVLAASDEQVQPHRRRRRPRRRPAGRALRRGLHQRREVGQADIQVDFVYTTSFVDPPQGSNAAQQMIDSGADVIFGAGGLTGNGALEAACQADGVLAIGVDTDQYETLPSVQSCILSSATKNIVEAVKNSLLRIAQDQFTPGFHTDNAATNGIGLAPFHDKDADVPADVKALLDDDLRRPRRRVDQDRTSSSTASSAVSRSVTTARDTSGEVLRDLAALVYPSLTVTRLEAPVAEVPPTTARRPTATRPATAQARRLDHRRHPRPRDRRRRPRRGRDHDRPGGRGSGGRASPRDARHHQALPGRRRQRRHRPVDPARARSTPCSARTAPARAR